MLRIRGGHYNVDMATVTSRALTLEQFSRLPSDGVCHEMNAGELITLPPPKSLHSRTLMKVLQALLSNLEEHPAWLAIPEAGYVLQRNPLTIRQPDVSVLSKGRVDATPEDSYFEGAPELAIEIVSPSDSAADLEIKLHQYLNTGSKQVWVLYPKTKDVHVFDAARLVVLSGDQVLEGGELLPGFAVRVSALFGES
jgi:Uma2 family endonuclease